MLGSSDLVAAQIFLGRQLLWTFQDTHLSRYRSRPCERENGSVEGLWLPVDGTIKQLLLGVQDAYGNELYLPESCNISSTIAFRRMDDE